VATWLFTLAAVAGAIALAVINGVEHWAAVALIGVSAALGALTRRGVGRYSTPARMWPWPIAVGTLAHGLRFVCITLLGRVSPRAHSSLASWSASS
jgi:hypothetical protein